MFFKLESFFQRVHHGSITALAFLESKLVQTVVQFPFMDNLLGLGRSRCDANYQIITQSSVRLAVS